MTIVHQRVPHPCLRQIRGQLRLPHALRQPEPARFHSEAPFDRLAHPVDLLDPVEPGQRRQHGLVEPREQQLQAPVHGEPRDPVEQRGFVPFEPLEQRTRHVDGDGEEFPLREPLQERAVHVAHVLLEHVVEVAHRLVEMDAEGEA